MRLIPLEQLQRGRVAVLEVNTVGRTLLFSISHTAINPAEGNGSDCSQDLWTPSLSSQATHSHSKRESNILTRSYNTQPQGRSVRGVVGINNSILIPHLSELSYRIG